MANKIITVTSGHSTSDSGAVSKTGVKEADLAVKLRNAIVHYLQKYKDVHVRLDGYGTTNLPLSEAIKLIAGSDVAVEIHLNASANEQANGVETISQPKDKALAQELSFVVAKVLGSKVRGTKGWISESDSARGRLGYIQKGGLILEVCFISNEKELKAFEDKFWLVAKEVANVLLKYVGVEVNE